MGLVTAKMLLDEGARVLVAGRSQAVLESAQRELGADAIVVSGDARSLADIDDLAAPVKSVDPHSSLNSRRFRINDLRGIASPISERVRHSSLNFDRRSSFNSELFRNWPRRRRCFGPPSQRW